LAADRSGLGADKLDSF
jgi:hypothetical protein